MPKVCVCFLSGFIFATTLIVSADTASLDGEWVCATNQANLIKFYGNRIGCHTTNNIDSCFQYLSAGTNSLSLNFGGGELEVVTYECGADSLDITDSNQVMTSYLLVNQYTNLCQKGVLQILGAQKVCRQEDPHAFLFTVEMMMQYLEVMPTCPAGGTYCIQPGQQPRCTSYDCNLIK